MSILLGKYSTLISIAILLAVIAAWQSPPVRLILFMIFLLFSVTRALASAIAKHRAARLRGRITSIVFVRNVLVETTFLLSVMTLAGYLGWQVAQLATQQIGDEFIKFAAGIVTGFLVGIGLGAALHSLWGRLMKAWAGNSVIVFLRFLRMRFDQ